MAKYFNSKTITALIIIVLGIIFSIFAYRYNYSQTNEASTRVVTDATNREVTIPTHPQRVVILNSSNVDLFYHAGGENVIVGKPTTKTLAPDVSKALAQVKEIGQMNKLNMEAILALKPDLIIGIDVPFHQKLVEEFKTSKVPVYINQLNNLDDVLNSLKLYGELANNQEAAQATIQKIKQQYETELNTAKSKNLEKNKVIVLWGTPDSMNLATSTSFVGALLKDIGVNNIADKISQKQAFIPLSLEYVAQENPNKIFVVTHGNPAQVKVAIEKLMSENPVWHNMPAVKAHQVFILPADLFAINPGTRISEALHILIQDLAAEN